MGIPWKRGCGYLYSIRDFLSSEKTPQSLHNYLEVEMAGSGESPAMVGDGVRLGPDTEGVVDGNLMVTPPPALRGPVIDASSMGDEGQQRIRPPMSNISSREMDTPQILHSHVSIMVFLLIIDWIVMIIFRGTNNNVNGLQKKTLIQI